MRILFVVTELDIGGAEVQLLRLAKGLLEKSIEIFIIALRGGSIHQQLEALGVPVLVLNVKQIGSFIKAFYTLLLEIRRLSPDIIQGWMYHGNLAATIAWALAGYRPKLVWGIRQSLYDIKREKPLTRHIIRLLSLISRTPKAIVYNSYLSRSQHEAFGFSNKRGLVINNGFDTEYFAPNKDARSELRKALGIHPNAPLIGLIARYHPVKGHITFLEAARRLAEIRSDVHFLLAGKDISINHPDLREILSDPVLFGRVHCLGERQDIASITAAIDIACSCSWSEAFPNVIGEAMSCGVPVVATKVGDVEFILGEAGITVNPGDIDGFVSAWRLLLENDGIREKMGEIGRKRIAESFSIHLMIQRYWELYKKL